ncbi:MAG TPA: DUF1648 domain-containing protein [Candidatus Stackebrandtia excrementipullorum]|nr:DUF1648 domain-containing protein [Candidatus Stackebrandtia excrementipullorum]
MTSRRSLSIVLSLWTLCVGFGAVLSWVLLSGRLPEPIAVHWGPDGSPDGSIDSRLWMIAVLGLWLLGAVAAAVVLKTTPDWEYRSVRRAYLVALFGWGGFVLGVHGGIVVANVDVERWEQAQTSPALVALTLLPAVVAGYVGWLVAGKQNRERTEVHIDPLELPTGDRVTWNTRVTARWALWASVSLFGLALITAGLVPTGLGGLQWPIPIVLAAAGIAGSAFTSFTMLIGARGVLIRFGVLGWPVWRIGLDQIESATVQDRQALELGGWGLRITPYGTAVMLRSGECLVVKRHRRKPVYITVNDAASAAAVLNGLLERESRTGRQ